MNTKELKETLKDAILHQEQLLIVGPPGCGKTEIVKQACEELKADLIISHPAVSDPTDYKGLPARAVDGKHAEFLAFGETWRAINANKLTVWFIDDLGQASEAVQKALMQLLLGRRLNGHLLSNKVVFVGATNDTGQRAGVTGLIEPVKSRWDSIIKIEVAIEAWTEWALAHGMPPELIAFLRSRPELLHKFEPTRELVNSPCPRTWANIGKRLARGVKNFELYSGAVGKGPATELLAFLEMATEAPSLDAILLNPSEEDIPQKPALKYLVISGLAYRATKKNLDKIMTYLDRMEQPFRVCCMRDCVMKDKTLTQTETFIKWVSDEGKEILEK